MVRATFRMLEEPDFDQSELAQLLHQNQSEILDLESKLELVKDKIARVKAARESDSMLKSFLLSKRAAVENLNRVIYGLPSREKKDLIEALIEGEIEIGAGEDEGEKWQIVRMPLVFKSEAFKGLLGGLFLDSAYWFGLRHDMESTSKIVVLEVRGVVQAVLAAPSGKCRFNVPPRL